MRLRLQFFTFTGLLDAFSFTGCGDGVAVKTVIAAGFFVSAAGFSLLTGLISKRVSISSGKVVSGALTVSGSPAKLLFHVMISE